MKQLLKILLVVTLTLLAQFMTISTKGQEFLPFVNDNYAGITGVRLNPSSIADSRYIVDITLFDASVDAYNNYASLNRKNFYRLLAKKDDGELTITENFDGKNKWMYEAASVSALNFMVSITPKVAFGVTGRVRQFTNVDNFNEDVLNMLVHGIKLDDHFYNNTSATQYFMKNMSISTSIYAEYGLSLAGVLWESKNKQHMIKAGLSAKLLQGLGMLYVNTSDAMVEFYRKDTAISTTNQPTIGIWGNQDKTEAAYLNYGVSRNIGDFIENNYEMKHFSPANATKTKLGAGFDLGFTYEWRPKYDDFVEEMDGKTGGMKYKTKYKLRIGFSATDIGWVYYQKSNFVRDIRLKGGMNFDGDFNGITADNYYTQLQHHLDSLIANNPTYSDGNNESEYVKCSLPTALSLQVDYNIGKGFFLNFTPYVALQQFKPTTTDKVKTHTYTIISLTPRFEHKWFGISVPLQYNQLSQLKFAVGLGLRLGPLWIGTNDLISTFCSKEITGGNIHAALKIPIMYRKKKDDDGDHVSNRYDKCPFTPLGVKVDTKGCPLDADGDGVPDYLDNCPNTPAGIPVDARGCPFDEDGDGVPDYLDNCPNTPKGVMVDANGCPLDTDGDGVPDYLDKCPDTPAGMEVDANGCPFDEDGDGVPDNLDKCPNTPKGVKVDANGCPLDADGDGVPDYLDKCPNTPEGVKVDANGCPLDADGDGVPDYLDKCPHTPAGVAVDVNGCPLDTDGDGVPDYLDECPTVPGVPENRGCPGLKASIKKIFEKALQGIQFETGKDIIKPVSFPIMNQIVTVMKENPTYLLIIGGHTDNVGNAAANQILSEKRAASVKNYLIKNGVEESRLTSQGFGDTRPVVENNTSANRAKNRRVEFTVKFEETITE